MSRLLAALVVLFGLVSAVAAGPWSSGGLGSGPSDNGQLTPVACGYSDGYCDAGTRRSCRGGHCVCLQCGGGGYYRRGYEEPSYREFEYSPRRPVCPPHYTVQDGVCKPYRGP
jgi:hypothetical protein